MRIEMTLHELEEALICPITNSFCEVTIKRNGCDIELTYVDSNKATNAPIQSLLDNISK
jgi:hypothetical protein